MTASKISGTVTQTVILGSAQYGSPLTITGSGVVAPTAFGTDGIVVPGSVHGGSIVNDGRVSGAYGGKYVGSGGVGIDFAAAGTLTNAGTISGGLGGVEQMYGQAGGYNGGIGVELSRGGHVTNTGHISGGAGGGNYDFGANGGDGVLLDRGTLANSGTITAGRAGGYGGYSSTAGVGGIGVDLAGGAVMTNSGLVVGGYGQTNSTAGGGSGVYLDASKLTNSGTITGGDGSRSYGFGATGAAGVSLNDVSVLRNTGLIQGGSGGYGHDVGGAGGAGVNVHSSSLVSQGTIIGGTSANGSEGAGGAGGTGVQAVDSSVTLFGTVEGGLTAAGNPASIGVYLDGGELVSGAHIIGGSTNGSTYSGGIGVMASQNAVLLFSDSSSVTGGAGGFYGGIAGQSGGGVGVDASGSGIIVNHGQITGGLGGSSSYGNTAGGTGVAISGGTLTNAGTISGGAGGSGSGVAAPQGDAVAFGSQGGTLVIDPGAVFNGLVVGDPSDLYALELAGSTAGKLSGLGSEFTGFGSVRESGTWTLAGDNTIGAGVPLLVEGSLTVTGRLLTDKLALQGGTFAAAASGRIAVGTTLDGAVAGGIRVDRGAMVTGIGTIAAGSLVDNGAISASSGTLTLAASVSGSGTATINGGATLSASGAVSGIAVVFASSNAELQLAAPTSVTSTISGFGKSDTIDLRGLVATSDSFSGGTLTLLDGKTAVDKIAFAGSYTTADFSVGSDGNGGTLVDFAADHKTLGLADFAGLLGHAASTVASVPSEAASAGWREAQLADLGWNMLHHGMLR